MVGFRLWQRVAVTDALGGLPLNLVPDDTVGPKKRIGRAAVGMRDAMSLHALDRSWWDGGALPTIRLGCPGIVSLRS
jgi:hypothetical protein